jgi:methionyl-tRNA formyltransferase
MTDPDPDLDPDAIAEANVAAAAIAGFTLAQFAFGELIKNGILPSMLKQAIETHASAGPGNRGAAQLLAVLAA